MSGGFFSKVLVRYSPFETMHLGSIGSHNSMGIKSEDIIGIHVKNKVEFRYYTEMGLVYMHNIEITYEIIRIHIMNIEAGLTTHNSHNEYRNHGEIK